MCGVAGLLDASWRESPDRLRQTARDMNDTLRHRGPDDDGLWVDAEAGVALAHRRLSIVDLTPAGHQPMVSADGRYIIIYNGEVYSHEDIRPSLVARGVVFRGHSDTEVILESISAFGVKTTVSNLNGMFAIALWDRHERTLTLIRDRLGIKPLYWAKFGDLFLFGSELKALRAHPDWTPRIDRAAVASFMRHNYIPSPYTIYQGVHKLEPGTILTLPWRGEPQIASFWEARAVANQGLTSLLQGSDAELVAELETLLFDAVHRRMIADVPVGAFLSGGVDSSLVVALMQRASTRPVKTFTIGFEIDGYNEAPRAAAIAKHLGTEHTEMIVSADQALSIVPRLAEWYDEPFADSSQIPTYLLSALTRRHVTVSLSGDGGDELFAGYNRYRLARRAWHYLSLLPQDLRRGIAGAITRVSAERWTRTFSVMPEGLRPAQAGDKLYKLASVLALPTDAAIYRRLVTHWEPTEIVADAAEHQSPLWDRSIVEEIPGFLDRMQFLDQVSYLPNDILTKIDRASMAVALEARVPFLDHRVVEFSWRLPARAKIRGGTSKWLLRQALYRHVPPKLIDRPKMGFAIPLAEWLRGPLRDWAETLLSDQRLRNAGLLNPRVVRTYWSEHLSGKRNWEYLIWDVLMLESWRERWA